jgi:hypothetical protein
MSQRTQRVRKTQNFNWGSWARSVKGDLTHAEMREKFDITTGSICSLMDGKCPSIDVLQRIATGRGMPLWEMLREISEVPADDDRAVA